MINIVIRICNLNTYILNTQDVPTVKGNEKKTTLKKKMICEIHVPATRHLSRSIFEYVRIWNSRTAASNMSS